jgi:hypothetical protein
MHGAWTAYRALLPRRVLTGPAARSCQGGRCSPGPSVPLGLSPSSRWAWPSSRPSPPLVGFGPAPPSRSRRAFPSRVSLTRRSAVPSRGCQPLRDSLTAPVVRLKGRPRSWLAPRAPLASPLADGPSSDRRSPHPRKEPRTGCGDDRLQPIAFRFCVLRQILPAVPVFLSYERIFWDEVSFRLR